jgi:hypothetical protein
MKMACHDGREDYDGLLTFTDLVSPCLTQTTKKRKLKSPVKIKGTNVQRCSPADKTRQVGFGDSQGWCSTKKHKI